MPKLILTFKGKPVSVHPLKKGTTTIGRHSSNDIVIEDIAVSGLHAHMDYQGQEILLTDLESKNGTYLAGQRITHAVLQHNDEITFGKHMIRLEAPKNNAQNPPIDEP